MAGVINNCWVLYAIQCEKFHKVGISSNLRQRMSTIALHNPFPIRCAMYRYVPRERSRHIEAAVHSALSDWRCGREWFTAPLDQIREAAKIAIEEDKATFGRWSHAFDMPANDQSVRAVLSHRCHRL